MNCGTCNWYSEFSCGGQCKNPASTHYGESIGKTERCEGWRDRLIGGGCQACPVNPCQTMTYRGSTCAAQRAKFGLGDPKTVYERIHEMLSSEHGMVAAIMKICDMDIDADLICLFCDGKNGCDKGDGEIACSTEMREACILKWLQSPVGHREIPLFDADEKLFSGLLEE